MEQSHSWEFYVLFTEHPSIILQIKPTWCTIFLSKFISFLYMFRRTMCPSSGEITFIYATLGICHSVWMAVRYAGWSFIPPCIPDSYPHRVTNIKCRIDKSYFSWWWAHSRPKHVEKRNKLTKKNSAPSWLYLQDLSWGDNRLFS